MLPTATDSLHPPAYNADNQLTSWNNVPATYDLNGNLTGDGTHTYTWDARNRMTAVTGTASFVYDAVSRRLSVTQGATTTASVYDGYDPVQEQSPIGTVAANVQTGLGTDERFTRSVGGTASYYLTDALGSTVGITNATGTAVQTTYSYDPYGVTTQAGTANTNPYKFTGRQDDGAGLYYFRARYYNPAWGRFVSEDPIGLAGGINLYAYVGGNPVGVIDPYGLLNPVKMVVSMLNAANAGRLYASGVLKLGAAAGLDATGVGVPAGVPMALWGLWNLKSGQAATQRASKQWGEAWCESASDASARNLLGVLPFGDKIDDPWEPTPMQFLDNAWHSAKTDTGNFLGEIGTMGF